MSEAAWHPDPSGRHQYRWWDGAAWTDSISDNGVVGNDPVSAASQTPTTPRPVSSSPATIIASSMPDVPSSSAPPAAGTPPSGAVPFGAQSSSTDFGAAISGESNAKKSSPLKWIIPVVVVLAVGAGLFLVLGGGDDDGGGSSFGAVEGELENDDSVVPFEYQLKRGDVIRVRIEPDSGLDAYGLALVDSATAREVGGALEDQFSDDGFTDSDDLFTDAEDTLSDADLGELDNHVVYDYIDSGDEGQPDASSIPVFVDGTYTIVVASDDSESSGSFRLIVEKLDESLPLDEVDSFVDFDEFRSDHEDFFSDDDFFSNEDEFETGS